MRVAAAAIRKHASGMTLDEAYIATAAKKYAFDTLDRTAYSGWRPPVPSYLQRQITTLTRRGLGVARKIAARP